MGPSLGGAGPLRCRSRRGYRERCGSSGSQSSVWFRSVLATPVDRHHLCGQRRVRPAGCGRGLAMVAVFPPQHHAVQD
eukprot:3729021-Pyramimonas_sp.AAC.1